MRIIFITCGLIILIGSLLLWHSFHKPFQAGQFTGAPKVEVIDVINKPLDFLGKTVALEGIISKQCTTMGCYFFFAEQGKELRVDLAKIAMNAPKGKEGRKARVEGRTIPYNDSFQFITSAVAFE